MSEASGAVSTGTLGSNERPARLFDEHVDRLYRLARRLAPSADEALDPVQEVFLRVARAPHAVPHGRREEEAWLVRVLVNISRDQWRKEAVRRRKTAHVGSVADRRDTAVITGQLTEAELGRPLLAMRVAGTSPEGRRQPRLMASVSRPFGVSRE